jgi:phosphopantetheinyl transferase
MPLAHVREITSGTYLALWEITETPPMLQQALQAQTGNLLPAPEYNQATRLSQWLSSRLLAYTLLQKFTPAPLRLQPNEWGKPIFENSHYHVSISHSRQLVAVILSEHHEVGIDIEFISPKVLRITSKFMHWAEFREAGDQPDKALIYWSAKETLFKLYGKKQLIFKEHILIEPFEIIWPGTLTGRIETPDFGRSYTIHYEKRNNYIFTYCLDLLKDIT